MKLCPENIHIKEVLKMDKNKVKEKSNLKMEIFIKETFKIIRYKELGNIYGQKVKFMMETGLSPKCMGKESILFLMEQNLKDFIIWEKDMEKVQFISVINNFTKVTGYQEQTQHQ